MHRAKMRRAMVGTAKALNVSEENRELSHNDPERAALGAYLLHLLIGANPVGRGKTARQTRKGGDVEKTDPAILGKFRVDMRDKDIKHCFVSRASR